MKVIKPTAFTETMLVSSNAAESSPNYSAGTTYAKDSIVNSGTHLYQSLVNNNLGNTPSTSPLYWLDIGPNNIHAMFDNQISTATISATPLNVVFKPGIFNSLALIGLSGNQVAVTVRDGTGGPIIYSATFALDGTVISDSSKNPKW
jgi:hypothetical protein